MKRLFQLYILLIMGFGCREVPTEQKQSSDLSTIPQSSTTDTSSSSKIAPTGCQLTITPGTSALPKYHVFQVRQFVATDPECWKVLQEHGLQFCGSKFPCRVIYTEKDHLGVDATDTQSPDYHHLKEYGIGEFTKFKTGYGWQMAGADAMSWDRNQEGFDYIIMKK